MSVVAIVANAGRSQGLLVEVARAEAELEVLYYQLAHLLRESALGGQLLQNLAEDGRVCKVVVRRKHEQSLFLLVFAHNQVRIFL